MDGLLYFTLERETKGAVRYFESDQIGNRMEKNFMIGTLYIRKDKLPAVPPTHLEVTVVLK